MNKNLEKFISIVEILETDKMKVSDFKEVVDIFFQVVKELKAYMDAEIQSAKSEVSQSTKTTDRLAAVIPELEAKFDKAITEYQKILLQKIDEISSRLTNETDRLSSEIPDLSVIEKKLVEIENSIPVIPPPPEKETPEEIRDSLETLKGEERLDKSAIKGLDEELSSLKKTKGVTIFGGGRGGGTTQGYVLTGLNGVLKTFTIPKNRRILTVMGSSAPFNFAPTTDYTGSGSTTLTFTSAINAGTSLGSDQTITVLYESLFNIL